MIKCSRKRLSWLLAITVAVACIGAQAQQPPIDRYNPGGYQQAYASGVSLDAAVANVQNRFRAKAVKTETVNERGHRVYYIRLLNAAGRVWTVRVDAETGNINK